MKLIFYHMKALQILRFLFSWDRRYWHLKLATFRKNDLNFLRPLKGILWRVSSSPLPRATGKLASWQKTRHPHPPVMASLEWRENNIPPLSTNTNSWPLARRHFDGCGVRRMRLWFRNAKYFCLGVRNRNEKRNLERGSVNLRTREKKYFYRSARTQRQNRGTRARGTQKLSGSRAHLCSYPDSTLTNHYKMSCYI